MTPFFSPASFMIANPSDLVPGQFFYGPAGPTSADLFVIAKPVASPDARFAVSLTGTNRWNWFDTDADAEGYQWGDVLVLPVVQTDLRVGVSDAQPRGIPPIGSIAFNSGRLGVVINASKGTPDKRRHLDLTSFAISAIANADHFSTWECRLALGSEPSTPFFAS